MVENKNGEKSAAELIVANKELSIQNHLKEKRAAELVLANKELVYQNKEKEKRAAELIIANKLKEKRAAELIIANKELAIQNHLKEKRAAELVLANKELVYQNKEKEKRAAELIIANKELKFQNKEKEKRAAELIIANERKKAGEELNKTASLLESTMESTADGILVVSSEGKILFSNRGFKELWKVPTKLIESQDDKNLIGYVLKQLSEPKEFLDKVKYLYGHQKQESFDTLHFKDGRIFERYSRPQYMNRRIVGRVWSFRDITKRKKAEEEIKKLADIVQYSYDGIISKDLDGTITSWNAGAERMYGYKADEVIGKSIKIIFPKEKLYELNELLDKSIKGMKIKDLETVRVRKDGKKIDIYLYTSPVKDSLGKITGISTIAADITEKKLIADKLREVYEKLTVLNNEKDLFVSLLAHELKSPLIPILGYTEMMIDGKIGPLTDEQKEKLEVCYRNAFNLNLLIGDFLDLTRLDLKKVVLDIKKHDIVAIVQEISNNLKTLAEEHNAQISIHSPQKAIVLFDRLRITQVVTNLVKNAIVHNQKKTKNEINIKIQENEKEVSVSIEDHGEGIAKDKIPLLFDRVARTENAVSSPTTGTGLGLIITKGLIEAHNGTLSVESKLGVGSTFKFTIPLKGGIKNDKSNTGS